MATAAPPVPLHRFEDLLIDGEVIRLEGTGFTTRRLAQKSARNPRGGGGNDGTGESHGSTRAAAGTDLDELDRLGMHITFAFERRRFDGRKAVVLPGDEP